MIGVCVKWVESVAAPGDDRYATFSPADQAALELALQHAALIDQPVHVVTVGRPAAAHALRAALACGAHHATHVVVDGHLPSDATAVLLANELVDAQWVWCGDYSLDNGTGSVPAMLAHHLHAAQALGVVRVDLAEAATGTVRCTRRLDGGRRELLALNARGVVSVEGSVARLRRAGLGAMLRGTDSALTTRQQPCGAEQMSPTVVPYRPRARALAAPAGDSSLDRLRALTDSAAAPTRGEVFEGSPSDAARRIVDALRQWGYLGDHHTNGDE
jgi:electron transfer flavoprotein beta subunit